MVGNLLLQDRYRIDDRLAIGGMGAVYRATDERLNRPVAIKLLKDELSHDPRFVERFRREARAVAALSHPNIANIYDYGQDESRHFIVMELVGGRDLASLLREDGPLEPERAARIGAQISSALAHAHAAGIVHRDIKPGNAIVDFDDRVKVTDFGIARAGGDSTLTATGSVLGTAHYLSPEQAGGGSVGPSSDIYSLGIVLFEMLTGSVPFTGDSAVAVVMRHTSEEAPPPSTVNPEVSGELDAVVLKAVAKSPAQRWRDAAELESALRAVYMPTAPARVVAPTLAMSAAGAATGPGSVWPIPDSRWNPQRVGRAVVLAFLILGLIAAAAIAWRLTSDTLQSRDGSPAQSEQPAEQQREQTPTEETGFTIPEDIIGMEEKDAESLLADNDLVPRSVDATGETDIVVGVEPSVGTEVAPGDTVTLSVGTGDEDDEEDDEEHVPPGQEKKEDKGNGHGDEDD